jgi:hypothetical protein
METVFRPHRYLFAMAKKIPVVTAVGSLLCWLPTVVLTLLFFDHLYAPLVRLSLIANLTVFFLALLCSMVLHEVCGTTVSVSDDGVVRKSPYKSARIFFENVTSFRYVRIPVLGGFGLIKVPGGSITLPFLIDGLDGCIEAVVRGLAAFGKRDAFNTGNIEEFRLRAIANGLSVRRMERTIPALSRIAVGAAAVSLLAAEVFWGLSFRLVLSWTIAGAVFPIVGYLIAEMLLRRRDVRTSTHDGAAPPDSQSPQAEETVYRWVGAATAAVYAVAGIIIKTFT